MKHIDSRVLWLQDLIAAGGVKLKKIPRAQNLADMLTLTLHAKELEVFAVIKRKSWWRRGSTNQYRSRRRR